MNNDDKSSKITEGIRAVKEKGAIRRKFRAR
jgi:hypothetical protein